MIVIAAILIGAALGWRRAARLGGGTKDRLQYAAGHAMLLAIAGLFLTIFIDRMI